MALPSRAALTAFTDFSLGGTTAGWDIFYGSNYLPTFIFSTGTAGNPITGSSDNLALIAENPGYMGGNFSTYATGPTGSDNNVPGDRETFYTFFASEMNFSINGAVADGETLNSFVFQSLNSSGSAGGLSNVLLNGVAADTSGTNLDGVDYWTWSDLNLTSGTTFSLSFDTLNAHTGLDAMQIQTDVEVVPEPSTYMLIALGLGVAFGLRRLKRNRQT